ncbi:immunity 22 family protein [Actinoplanes sp. NEAU-A12]|uniref:Immunity 22 family protein n=1 Tax=Actinoplanes sandaracinus TaxID=3045177 RepID=A0ABT6WYN7_9ACTN|nr:immunity 22 family protein [Actinoplanes sandaracinus]MDI6104721.1 immunity 22 family protein [Actinoplanes sandaracinus]
MTIVHVFVSTGRFASEKELRTFIEPTYTAEGDAVPSRFIEEIGLHEYEPFTIETTHAGEAMPVRQLLRDASWAEEWLINLDPELWADSGVCVFPPNVIAAPRDSSLEYCGAFTYLP